MKFICSDPNCSVYVFGASSTECPGCGANGIPMKPEHKEEFLTIYRKVQSS